MKMYKIFISLAFILISAASINAQNLPGDGKVNKVEAEAYQLLKNIQADTPGYKLEMDRFVRDNSHSSLMPQLYYAHALNCFDSRQFAEAKEYFDMIELKQLYKSQRDEYLFKKAYICMEDKELDEGIKLFKELESRPVSDFTFPARYALGYIYYVLKDFGEAIYWFEQSAMDGRFEEMSEYYILECRFMLKDYVFVTANGDALYKDATPERKSHLARIISEAWLVLGDSEQAKKYYEYSMKDGDSPDSTADWFYSGSVLYATGDYEGAIRSFSNMPERTDSLGQIANYHLGYSYILTKNKVAALTAFKDAAMADYDGLMAEDAYFNWAKLAFDINEDPSVFHDYLKRYPTKEKSDRINSYIAVAALHERDYAEAIAAYDKIDELDEDMRLNYMKANYLRAGQLIRNGSYRLAIPCLKAAVYYSDKDSRFNQLSRYWLAESYYRNDQYDEAIETFKTLYNKSALYAQPESYLIPYNIAYSYFKLNDYETSLKWFNEYLNEKEVRFKKEALLRKGDCFFITKRYKDACAAYDLVVNYYFDVNDIYPYYQAGLSYGFANNQNKKIELLSNVMKASPNAEFYPEALFELGRSYAVGEKDEEAFECFNKIVNSVKDSTFIARAYIEMGSLARNQSQYSEALGYYKTVVERMPLSGYAEDALAAIESIYQTRSEPEEYIAYIERIGKGETKSADEREMMIFNAAEQIFLSENYPKALISLQAYIDKYPAGANLYKAHFYMAEAYKSMTKYEQACDSYRKVIELGEGSFVEISMLNFSELSYRLENYEDAFGAYSSLYASARLTNNKNIAVIGMMRSAYKAHKWNDAIREADRILASQGADAQLLVESRYIKAKSYLATSRRDEAYAIFAGLADDPSSQYGAEAAYLLILDSYDKGEFTAVEDKVYALADAGTSQTYWLAKSFIVLGDSFVERDQLEQAKATFESVRDGYTPSADGDDVLDNVDIRLRKLSELLPEAFESVTE